MSKSNIQVNLDDLLDEFWQKYNRNRRTIALSDVEPMVEALRLKIPKSGLEAFASRFSYIAGDPLPRLGRLYRTQGYLTHNQASELRKWKTPQGSRKFKECNNAEKVRICTSMAARAADKYQDAPDFAVWLLGLMKSLAVATGSAFLTAWNPDEFGIIDKRCWATLFNLTGSNKFDRSGRTVFLESEFFLYINLLRRWRDLEGVSPRLIDKALWQFDKENPATLYEEGITFTDHQHIIRKASILSGEPIIKGTRTPVRAIVELSLLGYTPEKILDGLPHLSLEAIHDALSYYNDHTKEIEGHIERNKVPDNLIHPSVRGL